MCLVLFLVNKTIKNMLFASSRPLDYSLGHQYASSRPGGRKKPFFGRAMEKLKRKM